MQSLDRCLVAWSPQVAEQADQAEKSDHSPSSDLKALPCLQLGRSRQVLISCAWPWQFCLCPSRKLERHNLERCLVASSPQVAEQVDQADHSDHLVPSPESLLKQFNTFFGSFQKCR